MTNLCFDPVKVDTSLAQEYIKKKYVVVEIPKLGTAWDYAGKKVIMLDEIKLNSSDSKVLNSQLRFLSKKVQDNAELFCQLEYLLRKTDVDETRNYHLKLISQYFRCEDCITEWNNHIIHQAVYLEESTPLYYLGHVATMLRRQLQPILVCDKTTAPLCHLLYELCLDVGLAVSLYIVNKDEDYYHSDKWSYFPIISMSCTLAITEEADVDSALDVFLNSSSQAPWRIDRIFAEVNVYDQLLKALEARCERVPSERCVAAFRTRCGRTLECGVGGDVSGAVPVRGYRDARELLALLPAGGFLSLWCSSVTTAHEIALASDAHIVWIDSYAIFDGPPSITIPLYNTPLPSGFIQNSAHTKLLNVQRAWTTLPLDERKAVVLNALEKLGSVGSSKVLNDIKFSKLVEDIKGWTSLSDQVELASDRITMVIDHPRSDVLCMKIDENNLLKVLKLMILGYGCILKENEDSDLKMFTTEIEFLNIVSALCEAAVPLIITKTSVTRYSRWTEKKTLHEMLAKSCVNNKKVIQSRFGTKISN